MKTRHVITIIFAVCVLVMGTVIMIRLLIHLSVTKKDLTAYLYKHELVIPSNSEFNPEILKERLSKESLQEWIHVNAGQGDVADKVLADILLYLKVGILLDMPEDPLVQYTHYYHMEITNESDKLFKNVYIRFPDIRAVEIHRDRSDPEVLAPIGNRYTIGDIRPDEQVDIYAWNNRPFLFEEENNIVLRHSDGQSSIIKYIEGQPERSWIRDNIILVIIFGSLILLLAQKMVMVIQSCVKTVEPKIEKRITLE
jgi:hypothetical protein